jgi:tetratricopeptide (TPR) repeat protein
MEAEPVFRRSVSVRELSLGPLNPELAPALENLAAVWTQLERFAEAEGGYRRALELWSFQLGPGHPNLAGVMDRIGHACASQKKYEDAENAYRSALWIRDRQSVTNLNNLALIVAAREQPTDAEPLYKVALTVLEPPAAAPAAALKKASTKSAEAAAPTGPAHPDLLRITLHNYAELMRETNRPAAAKRLEVREKQAEELEKRMQQEAQAKAREQSNASR